MSVAAGTGPVSVAGGGFMLNRALPLAALHLVRARAVPVDELLHRLEAELGRQGQVLDLRFEALGPDPLGEGIELLALVALGLVQPYPALDRLRDAFGRQP